METKKNIYILTENKQLYLSFERAFNYLVNYKCYYNLNFNKIKDPNGVFLIDALEEPKNLKEILNLRLNMCLGAILALVYQKKNEYYSDFAIQYYTVPFVLKEVIDSIKWLPAISEKDNLIFIISWLSKASHDIKGMLYKPNKAINIINDICHKIETVLNVELEKKRKDIISCIKNEADKSVVGKKIENFFDDVKGGT